MSGRVWHEVSLDLRLVVNAIAPRLGAAAIERDETMQYARCVGLSETEAREVIAAYAEHHLRTPHPLDWDRVRAACVRRALGAEWKP